MRFTSKNLQYVRYGLDSLLVEVQNQIATCPEPDEHSAELAAYEKKKVDLQELIKKVDAALEKEAGR